MLFRLSMAAALIAATVVIQALFMSAGLSTFKRIEENRSSLGVQWRFCLRAALSPKLVGNSQRIDFALLPPPPLITHGMIFAVVDGAQRHREFIADFERDSLCLGVADVMSVSWGAATNQAWLAGYKA